MAAKRKPAVPQTVEEAVLADIAKLPLDMQAGGVARVAVFCARELDSGMLPPREAASFSREIRLALAQLRDMAPGEVKGDVTDEVRAKREKRMAEAHGTVS